MASCDRLSCVIEHRRMFQAIDHATRRPESLSVVVNLEYHKKLLLCCEGENFRGRAREFNEFPSHSAVLFFFLLLTYSVEPSTPDDACRPGYDRVIFMYKTSLALSSVVLYRCVYVQYSTVSPPTLSHCTTVNFSLAPRARISNEANQSNIRELSSTSALCSEMTDGRLAQAAQGRSQAKTSTVIQSSRQTSRSPCRRYHNDREQRD